MSTTRKRLLGEFDHEMATTRRVLAAVPEGRLEWRPHPRSFPMGRLAGHVAETANWPADVVTKDRLDVGQGKTPENMRYTAASREELLAKFDAWVKDARAALATIDDEALDRDWVLAFDGHEVLRLPRYVAMRSFCLNHHVHHRAQLTVYLRMNDAKVPSVYGPSADES